MSEDIDAVLDALLNALKATAEDLRVQSFSSTLADPEFAALDEYARDDFILKALALMPPDFQTVLIAYAEDLVMLAAPACTLDARNAVSAYFNRESMYVTGVKSYPLSTYCLIDAYEMNSNGRLRFAYICEAVLLQDGLSPIMRGAVEDQKRRLEIGYKPNLEVEFDYVNEPS